MKHPSFPRHRECSTLGYWIAMPIRSCARQRQSCQCDSQHPRRTEIIYSSAATVFSV